MTRAFLIGAIAVIVFGACLVGVGCCMEMYPKALWSRLLEDGWSGYIPPSRPNGNTACTMKVPRSGTLRLQTGLAYKDD